MKKQQLDLSLVSTDSAHYRGFPVEVLFSEKLVWAGLKCGVAGEQTPLPISVWEEGCVWRKNALEGLEAEGIDYRVTFKSSYMAAQKAAILADLVVAPIPLSVCDGDIIDVTESFGLPPLTDYHVGLITQNDLHCTANAVIDHLRSSFAMRQAA